MPEHDVQLEERIPGNLSNSVFEGLQHEKSRQHIIGIIKDYTEHADFMEKVRKYAGQEIDARIFTSLKFYLTAGVTAVITSILGIVVEHFLRW